MNSGTTAASSGAHGATRHYTGGKGVGRQSWIQVSKTLSAMSMKQPSGYHYSGKVHMVLDV